jgi:glycosylphosphatidylinositol transamidase (GPIT) subunit GPI8
VIDRYTHVILNYLEGINKTSTETLQDLFNQYNYDDFHSNAGIRDDLFARDVSQVRLTDFFGGVQQVDMQSSVSASEDENTVDQAASESPFPRKQRDMRERARKRADGDAETKMLRSSDQVERRYPLHHVAGPAALLAGGYLLASGISRATKQA